MINLVILPNDSTLLNNKHLTSFATMISGRVPTFHHLALTTMQKSLDSHHKEQIMNNMTNSTQW